MTDAGRTAAPTVSVIIVTWNSRDDVLRCLASVNGSGVDLEVLVVDNGSEDGTVAAVRAAFPEAQLIEGHGNIGFPAANNLALARARGRYVLFLNPDTELHDGTLEASVAALDGDPSIGMVGCRLVYPDGKTQYESARRAYRLGDIAFEALWLHMFFPRHPLFARQLMGDWDHLGERDVEAISGAFMLVRREAAIAVGGLPEDLFMYHEDLSFCLRLRAAGWRIRYLGDVTATHYSGQSSSVSPARLHLLEGEMRQRLVGEAQGPVAAAMVRPIYFLRSLLRLGIALPGRVMPGLGGLRRRYPKVFHVRMHVDHLLWSVWPGAVRGVMPGVPARTSSQGPGPTATR